MIIEYKGINKEEKRYHREAWITYEEINKNEKEKADRICEILESCGWDVYHEYGWIVVKIYDKEDYKELIKIYKKMKHDLL